MIFVDTSAWFASVVPWDANHHAAQAWLNQNSEPLVTSDFVIDETLTLLLMRRERERATRLGSELFGGALAPLDVRKAWDVFRKFTDKSWSFTDCTSRVVMERLSIPTAFAFDQHFYQFGTVQVVP